jgi:hypothetical protein
MHQLAMRGLVQRRGGECALQRVHGLIGCLELRKLEAERAVQLAERRTPRVGPALVAILREQLAAIESERRFVRLHVAELARACRGVFEAVDVARYVLFQHEEAVAQDDRLGTEHAPRRVQGLAGCSAPPSR